MDLESYSPGFGLASPPCAPGQNACPLWPQFPCWSHEVMTGCCQTVPLTIVTCVNRLPESLCPHLPPAWRPCTHTHPYDGPRFLLFSRRGRAAQIRPASPADTQELRLSEPLHSLPPTKSLPSSRCCVVHSMGLYLQRGPLWSSS